MGPATRGLVSSGTAFSDREQGVESAVEQLEPGLARKCDAGTTNRGESSATAAARNTFCLFLCFKSKAVGTWLNI